MPLGDDTSVTRAAHAIRDAPLEGIGLRALTPRGLLGLPWRARIVPAAGDHFFPFAFTGASPVGSGSFSGSGCTAPVGL